MLACIFHSQSHKRMKRDKPSSFSISVNYARSSVYELLGEEKSCLVLPPN